MKVSNVAAGAHCIKAMIGSGVLTIPYAYLKAGIGGATIGLVLLGILAYVTMVIMIDNTKIVKQQFLIQDLGEPLSEDGIQEPKQEEVDYGTVGKAIFGPFGSILASIFVIIECIGVCLVYISYIATLLNHLRDSILEELGVIPLAIMVFVFLVIVTSINLRWLSFVSAMGTILLTISLVAIVVAGINKNQSTSSDELKWWPSNMSDIISFLGVSIFIYCVTCEILPIEQGCAKPEAFRKVLAISISIVTILYITFGICCYVAWRSHVEPIVMTNLNQNDISTTLIQFAFVFMVLMTFPLTFAPAIASLASLLSNIIPSLSRGIKVTKPLTRILSRILLVTVLVICGFAIHDVAALIILVGGCNGFSALIFPSVAALVFHSHSIQLLTINPIQLVKNPLLHCIFICIGVLASIGSIIVGILGFSGSI